MPQLALPGLALRAEPAHRWRFHSKGRTASLEEERRFQQKIRSALRVAAGLGRPFSLQWASGGLGGFEVEVAGRRGAAWFTRALTPCYEFGQWSTVRSPPTSLRDEVRRFGQLSGSTELPLPFATDGPPWADAALLGLEQLPPGVSIVFEIAPGTLVPAPTGSLSRPLEPRAVRVGDHMAPPPALVRGLRDRIADRQLAIPWAVSIGLRARASTPEAVLDQIAAVLQATSRLEGGNSLRFPRALWWRRSAAPVLLSEPEVAGLFASPWSRAANRVVPLASNPGISLGRSTSGRAVRLPVDPDQGRHLLVLGETGMGKSTLLVQLLRRASRRGGVVLLDPIGDTGRMFLQRLDEPSRSRADWISPTESPIAINAIGPLRSHGPPRPEQSDRRLHELVAALRRVRFQRFSEGAFWGPRIEEVLARAVGLASALPEGTLADAYSLLADDGELPTNIPGTVAAEVHGLRSFAHEHPEEVGGSRRVLGEIVHNAVLARMLCATAPRFDLSHVGRPGAITVITADAPRVGEATARYLLATYLALLWSELLSRPTPTKVFLALEEAQWYAHEGLMELLRLGRRGNVHVWTATQSLRSLPEGLREALLTNTADLVLFRGDPDEAREFSRWAPEVTPERLMALERGNAACMIGKGSDVEWLVTEPIRLAQGSASALDAVREATRARWGGTPDTESADSRAPSRGQDPVVGSSGRPLPVLLDLFRRFLHNTGLGSESTSIWVRLPELARSAGLGPEELRRLGSHLKETGVLLASERSSKGRRWRIEPSGGESAPSPRP